MMILDVVYCTVTYVSYEDSREINLWGLQL